MTTSLPNPNHNPNSITLKSPKDMDILDIFGFGYIANQNLAYRGTCGPTPH